MVATKSSMQALGSVAPTFALPDTNGELALVQLSDFSNQPLLVAFICNHCPFVVHVAEKFADLANQYQAQGYGVIAISANDVENYPQDGPEQMQRFADQYGFKFAYCYDESQSVAKSFGAECTPDFFVYDRQHQLRYRGQMDESRPGNGVPVDGIALSDAMQAILHGREVSADQVPSIGCNIKWKS